MSFEKDLAQAIGADVVLAAPPFSLVYGTSVREGPVRKESDNPLLTGAVPHKCVFVLGTTGITDEPWVDGGTRTGLKKYGAQIWVRSEVEDYDAGRALADAVFNAVDKVPPAGYLECRALNSGPAYVRKDAMGHHEWTINVILHQQV